MRIRSARCTGPRGLCFSVGPPGEGPQVHTVYLGGAPSKKLVGDKGKEPVMERKPAKGAHGAWFLWESGRERRAPRCPDPRRQGRHWVIYAPACPSLAEAQGPLILWGSALLAVYSLRWEKRPQPGVPPRPRTPSEPTPAGRPAEGGVPTASALLGVSFTCISLSYSCPLTSRRNGLSSPSNSHILILQMASPERCCVLCSPFMFTVNSVARRF